MHDTEKYFIPREFLKIRIPSQHPRKLGAHQNLVLLSRLYKPLQCFPEHILLTCMSLCQKAGISVFLQSKHLLRYFDFSQKRGRVVSALSGFSRIQDWTFLLCMSWQSLLFLCPVVLVLLFRNSLDWPGIN